MFLKLKKENLKRGFVLLIMIIAIFFLIEGSFNVLAETTEKNQYVIYFSVDGPGEIVSGSNIIRAHKGAQWWDVVDPPVVKADEGYEFLGWDQGFPETILKSMVIRAKFGAIDESVPPLPEKETNIIKFISFEGGSISLDSSSYIVDSGSLWEDVIRVPAVKPDSGYAFLGWDLEFPKIIKEDMIFVAKYINLDSGLQPENKETFLVLFSSEPGGKIDPTEASQKVEAGSNWDQKVKVPNVVVDSGYKFLGWDIEFPQEVNRDLKFVANIINEEEYNKEPEVEYAYMLDGKFYIGIKDQDRLKKNPYSAVIDGEDVDSFKDGFKIEQYPTILILDIESKSGKTTEALFNIGMPNEILEGKVSKKIEAQIKKNQESNISFFDGFDHIIEGEYNKIVNIYDLFKSLILKEFGPHNEGDITITSKAGLTIDKDYNVLLDKEGMLSFRVGHTFYTDDYVNVYIYVDNKGVKYTNIEDFHIINPGLISKDSIKLIDFIEFELTKDGYEPDTSYLVAKDVNSGRNIELNSELELEDGKHYKYRIYDILSEKEYIIEFMKPKAVEIGTASYSDVPGKHWAFYSIKNLTLSEFISGYPDKTFRPDANITVREFSTILSRYLSNLDNNKLKPVVESYYIGGSANWGLIETKAVLSTIPRYKMSSFSITNIDRPISREEVSFLIANNVNLELKKSYKTPFDSMTSKYPIEVLSMISSGIMEGYPDGTFKPSLNITRAEIATIFNKLINSETY